MKPIFTLILALAATATAWSATPSAGRLTKADASAVAPVGTPAKAKADKQAAPAAAPAARSVQVPWTADFSSLAGFTVIDANDDDTTWEVAGGVAECSYSAKDPMDDWLITPGITLYGGRAYTLTITAACNSSTYAERMEILYGEAPTVAAMTTVAKNPFIVDDVQFTTFTAVIVPRITGDCFIGFHGISDADKYKLRIGSITLTEGAEGDMPAGVADFDITTGGAYDLNAQVSMVAPLTTMAGHQLNTISSIEVTRNGELVKTFANPAVGASLSFADPLTAGGEYLYTATAINGDGRGYTMRRTINIGGVAPMYPEEVTLTELGTPGALHLEWTPVTTDVEGNTIPDGFVKYVVVDSEMELLTDDLTDTHLDFSVTANEPQFVQFIVAAMTPGGLGEGTMSNMRAIGPAMNGFSESFADGAIHSPMAVGYEFGFVDYVGWGLADDTTFATEEVSETTQSVTSYDHDNGFAYMYTEYANTGASLLTAKIALPASGPGVSFAIYNQGTPTFPDNNLVELLVSTDGDNWDVVSAKSVHDYCGDTRGWHLITEGLQAYAGQTVQIRWQVTAVSFSTFLIDAIDLTVMADYDLKLESLTLPAEATPGQQVEANVTVLNNGAKSSGAYSVSLIVNGNEVAQVDCPVLAPAARKQLAIPFTVSPVATEDVEVSARINWSADMFEGNNASATLAISPALPRFPYVTDLNGTADEDGNVSLTWSKPYIDGYAAGETEGFESGDDFAHSFGDWIFIDADGLEVGGISPSTVPGIEPGVSKASFMVFNADAPTFNSAMHAHSGKKYIASLFSFENEMIDDWAITPELNGAPQTVSFWARSLEAYYAETMEIRYSFGSTDPDDFILITTVPEVPGEWTQYNIPIPAGAKRFAVRNHSAGAFALLLDDFYFADKNHPAGVTLEGYNIYDNDLRIGTVDGDTHQVNNFACTALPGDHTFAVTARYATLGESRSSNKLHLTVADGNGISAATATAGRLYLEGNTLVAEGLAGNTITVSTLAGQAVVTADLTAGRHTLRLAPGIYLIRCGSHLLKAAIR